MQTIQPGGEVLSAKVSPAFAAQVRGLAKANRMTMSALIKRALKELLAVR